MLAAVTVMHSIESPDSTVLWTRIKSANTWTLYHIHGIDRIKMANDHGVKWETTEKAEVKELLCFLWGHFYNVNATVWFGNSLILSIFRFRNFFTGLTNRQTDKLTGWQTNCLTPSHMCERFCCFLKMLTINFQFETFLGKVHIEQSDEQQSLAEILRHAVTFLSDDLHVP